MAEQRSSNGNKQRGSTFLSFVGGVVVGLGVALAVAVYVTNIPIPFLNKNLPRKSEQDAAEVRKNKDWDPNAVLSGKNPAPRSAASAATPAPAATVPAQPPVMTAPAADDGSTATEGVLASPKATRNATAAARAEAKAEAAATRNQSRATTATSDDPLGDLARTRAARQAPAQAAPAATGADPFNYLVQAGAYNTMGDAEAQRAKLSMQGIDSKITEREQSGRTVYRVRVGPFDTKSAADSVKERLDSGGTDSTLVRVQR